MIRDFGKRLDTLVWGDRLQQYGLSGRMLSVTLRYLYALLRDTFSGQLTLRSMSLVYTTLLSVVPLIAFSFAVLKGLGAEEELENRLSTFLEPLGQQGEELITSFILTLVENVSGGVLGGLGLAFFVFTAITMVEKIEESFNYVWYVTKPRSFARRFTEYMLFLLIGPVVIVITLGAIASLQNEAVFQWLANNAVFGPLIAATTRLTPYLLVTAVFTAMYWQLPNASVRFRSALIGGVAGGFLWATAGVIFAAFLTNATNIQAIYASFAIAIFALIWLYLNWLILLIGAQLAFYVQNPAYLRLGRREPRLSNAMRERLALNVMLLVGHAFRDASRKIDLRSLSRQLRIPSITVAPIIAALEHNGLITADEEDHLLPGQDVSQVTVADILDVVRIDGETGSFHEPNWNPLVDDLGNSVDAAVQQTISGRTLSALLDQFDQET